MLSINIESGLLTYLQDNCSSNGFVLKNLNTDREREKEKQKARA